MMNYRNFGRLGVEVSALGFGAMRFPTMDGDAGSSLIDEEKAIGMIRHAIDSGLNYVDTAYPYHKGASEIVVGKALKDGYREKTFLATKSPVWKFEKAEDFDTYLDEQLKKLDVDHIDFYLLHALSKDRWENVILKFGIMERMEKAKADGKIRYLGFSFHDELDAFKEIIDGYDHWDFCQIQLNYINTDYQAGLEGYRYATEKGLGIIIMEPLLGGKLAVPPEQVKKVLGEEMSPVERSLAYLWDLDNVSVILSGMNTMEQVEQNLSFAGRSGKGTLTAAQREMYERAKVVYDTMALVPCTKCQYCMPCPFGLDIPGIFESYNSTAIRKMDEAKAMYFAMDTLADSCTACKACEAQCPQNIRVSEIMPVINGVFA
jgi:hypothetical protein